MPYTRAYQLPSLETAQTADHLHTIPIKEEKIPLLNITPSSNWIQETFNLVDQLEDERHGPVFVVEKAVRPSLYQKIVAMQVRAKMFSVTLTASEPVPTEEKLKDLIKRAGGDPTKLDQLKKDWEKEILERYTDYDFGKIIRDTTEETIYLDARQVIQGNELASIKFTISSPELPTKGDLPITAIYYTSVSDMVGDGIPFTWTDKSGFLSTMVIFPNVIYPIQPVSIDSRYALTLLA